MTTPETAAAWAQALQPLVGTDVVLSAGLVAENAYTHLDTVEVTPLCTLHVERVSSEGEYLALRGKGGPPPCPRLGPLTAPPKHLPQELTDEVLIPVADGYLGLDSSGFFLAAWQDPEQPERYRYARGQFPEPGTQA